MAEEAVLEQPIVAPNAPEIITPANGFADSSWSTKPLVPEPAKPAAPAAADKPEEKPKPAEGVPEEEIVDEIEYLEKQTGFKSWDEVKALKAEAEKLRVKAQTPAERKFANEESKRLAEAWEAGETDKVFDYLNTQRQLKKAADLPASEAIKLHLQQSNPHYKAEDVQDVFDEKYSIPKKPVQQVGEEAENFQERMDEYTQRVAKVNRAIERDGVTAKQELAKRITELVPPEIPKREIQPAGPTKEELEGRLQFVDSYVKSVPTALKKFEGFYTSVKDDDVEIPISYVVTDEDRAEIQAELEGFAKNNLDANLLFEPSWLNKDGSVNVKQVAEDRYLLKNRDKIFKKIANEGALQLWDHRRKVNSNIKVDGKAPVVTASEKNETDKILEHFWKNG